jgi:hypothetical protein
MSIKLNMPEWLQHALVLGALAAAAAVIFALYPTTS